MTARDQLVMRDVLAERDRQRALGHTDAQDYADGTGRHLDDAVPLPSPGAVRAYLDAEFGARRGSWALVLLEEVLEAMHEHDVNRLREELVQVAAVAVRWAGALDARGEDDGA